MLLWLLQNCGSIQVKYKLISILPVQSLVKSTKSANHKNFLLSAIGDLLLPNMIKIYDNPSNVNPQKYIQKEPWTVSKLSYQHRTYLKLI